MIAFFRRFRQQLLSENKVSKYLLYAIGEIVLVVIGILIALQINNWNEKKKLQEQERQLLVSFQKELEENIDFLSGKVNINNTIMAQMNKFLELAGKDSVTSYDFKTYMLIFDYRPAIVEAPILEDILKSESKALITRSDLLPKLRALRSAYKEIEKGEFYLDEFWNDKVTDYIITSGAGYVIYSGLNNEDLSAKIQKKKLLKIDNHFLSLVAIKKDLQTIWLKSQLMAMDTSMELLQLLKEDTTLKPQ